CDPPYLPLDEKDSFTHYNGKAFTKDDHRALAAHLVQASQLYGVTSVISNSDTEGTRRIYSPFELHPLSVRRSVAASSKAREKAQEVIGVLHGQYRNIDVNAGFFNIHPTNRALTEGF
ncbi:DNA adenine methylase, partial [Salmonella enterica]|nr:DNA adenine methylase [Salmonella enterica]